MMFPRPWSLPVLKDRPQVLGLGLELQLLGLGLELQVLGLDLDTQVLGLGLETQVLGLETQVLGLGLEPQVLVNITANIKVSFVQLSINEFISWCEQMSVLL